MKLRNIMFAISIATLTACGTSEKNNSEHNHSHNTESHEHAHSHDEAHNHVNCGHNHAAHNHSHAKAAHNHSHESVEHNHNHNEQVHAENSDEIAFSEQKAKYFGVKTEKVTKGTFNDIIKVSGQIMPSQSDESVISAKSSGIIKLNSNAIEGKQLSAGTSIGQISSHNVAGGDANEVAKINFEAAKRELERITPLYEDKIITEREYNQAKQTYAQAKAALSGNSGAGSNAACNISGTIAKVYVKDGEYVEIGTPIALVSKNAKLILRADLPNKYAPILSSIKTANFKPAYTETVYDLAEMNGKIVSNRNLSIVTPGYIPVNFEFTNNAGIVAGTYAEIYLIGTSKDNCITVPLSAITEEEGYFFVYEKVHHDAYTKKEVKLGMNNGTDVEILSGLHEGDDIVTTGAVFIKLSQAATVPGHSHEH